MTDRKTELFAAARKTADDHARLVLADFLEDSGDPRGLVIRLQCLLATIPAWDPRAVEAQWEVDHLLAKHADTWRAELPQLEGVEWRAFERGFVTSVRVPTVAALYAHADAIAAATPVYKVELANLDERHTPAPEAGLPWLRTLQISLARWAYGRPARSLVSIPSEIEIVDAHYDGVAFLANRSDEWPLTRISISGDHPAGTSVIRTIATQPGARALRELGVGTSFVDFNTGYYQDPTLRVEGSNELASARFAHVEVLDISGQHVEGSGLATIVDSLPALRELSAPGNDVTDLDFFPRSTGAAIVRLDLSSNLIGDHGASMIATAPRLAKLESLKLDTCELHGDSITALAVSPFWHALRELDLSRNPLGVDGALALAASPRPARLHTLRLADVDQNAEAAKVLAEIEWLDQLVRFDASQNTIAGKLLRSLASVRELILAKVVVEDSLADALEHVWTHAIRVVLDHVPHAPDALPAQGAPELQQLALAHCAHDGSSVDRLLAGGYPRLRYLSLAGGLFNADTIVQLFASPLPAQLDTLVLSHCTLGEDAAVALASADPGRIRTLDLRHNEFTPNDLLELGRSESLRRVKRILLSGEPYNFPQEYRDALAMRFGQHWYYHEDEEEPPEHPYGEVADDEVEDDN